MSASVTWSAPGRVNLIGEHTDYNDGYVLPFALSQRCTVTASRLDGPQWLVHSDLVGASASFTASTLAPGSPDGWGAYVAGVVWALREAGYDVPGAELSITSDVPLGAGLSSSAALECAVLAALVDLGGVPAPRTEWIRLAQRAENGYVGVPCGIMDQSAATLCRAGHALFLDCRTLASTQVPFDLAAAGLAMLVIDTRAPHRHVGNEYAARRASCEAAAAALGVTALRDIELDALPEALAALDSAVARRRVRHVVTENERVLECVRLLRSGAVSAIGPVLTASHTSLRDDYQVSIAELDTAVDAALAAGAYGARMTGGGFGGCVIALVDADAADQVAAAVVAAFARAGHPPPSAFRAVPSDGASRVPQPSGP